MLIENYNAKTVKISLTRHEVIDLLLILVVCRDGKYLALHDKIREQLDAFDQKQETKK